MSALCFKCGSNCITDIRTDSKRLEGETIPHGQMKVMFIGVVLRACKQHHKLAKQHFSSLIYNLNGCAVTV